MLAQSCGHMSRTAVCKCDSNFAKNKDLNLCNLIEVWIEGELELSFVIRLPFHFLLSADVSKPPHELKFQ